MGWDPLGIDDQVPRNPRGGGAGFLHWLAVHPLTGTRKQGLRATGPRCVSRRAGWNWISLGKNAQPLSIVDFDRGPTPKGEHKREAPVGPWKLGRYLWGALREWMLVAKLVKWLET